MLGSDTPSAVDFPDVPATPPRRRSATRPAGPPAPVPDAPAPAASAVGETQPAESAQPGESAQPARTRRPRATAAKTTPAKAKAPVADDGALAVDGSATVGESPVAAEPAKPARTRRTKAAAPADPAADDAPEKPARTRRPKPVADADQVPTPADTPQAAEPQASSGDAAQPAVAAPADDAQSADAAPAPRRRRATRAAGTPAPLPPADAPQVPDAAPAPEAGSTAAALEASAPSASRRRPRRGEPVEAFGLVAGSPDEMLNSLAAAIAGEPTEPADADFGADDFDAGTSDDEPRRRRRRRGGRRRRRSGDEPFAGSDDDADDSEAVGADDAGESEASEGASADGAAHHRRRRRRRGEEIGTSDDDPLDVVVRVREPRRAPSGSGEVTGIEGSTRVEAKKQRRRENRSAGRRRAPILSESEFLARRESVERSMLIRQAAEYAQVAVMEDGVLVEHYVDRASSASVIGNIYLGKVQNVLPSMEAAFIDIGRGRNAVLYAGEVDWDSFGENGADRKVEEVFTSGQPVLVQVSKDPVGAKGARLTSHISIPGRYIVYSPGGHLSGISRKLPEPERKRLKDIIDQLIEPTASVIVRTAAEGVSEEELVHDINRLKAQWEVIDKKVKSTSAPQLLYAEPDLTVRIVRDLFTEDFTSLVVDGNSEPNDAYDTVEAYVAHVAPHLSDRVQRWDRAEKGDLFDHYRIQEQIAKALERKVFLPSGGSLVIDRTEAMTVIDVNTGRFTGTQGNLEATVTANNLEAAEEIVRQLRLRDIGGIIVVDFIDMVLPSNRELLLRRLVECLGRDRTRHQVAEVTSLGLVQMTRKKIGTGLAEAFTVACETCDGRGYHTHDVPVASQAPADGGERDRSRRRGGKAKSKKKAD